MHLVHQIDLTVLLAELVLGVHQNQSVLCRYLASTLVDGPCVSLKLLVILSSDKSLGDDLLLGDVLVVSLGGLRGRGHKRLRKLLVLYHPVRHRHTADRPLSSLVLPPGMSGEVAADDHLNLERLTLVADGDSRIRHGHLPVRKDVGRGVQKFGRYAVQHLSLVGNPFRQDHIKR